MSPVGHSQSASAEDAATAGLAGNPSALLRAAAATTPDAPAFLAPAGRMGSTGRDAVHLDFAQADIQVDRLAGIFRSLGLPHGALLGVSLLAGPEACLTIIALDRAGLTPLPFACRPGSRRGSRASRRRWEWPAS